LIFYQFFSSSSGEEEASEDSTEKEKPNYKPSGLLLKDIKTNSRGVEAKYLEPADAAQPTLQWRLYPFKGKTPLGKSTRVCALIIIVVFYLFLFVSFLSIVATELNR
jgi:hypothetical protein